LTVNIDGTQYAPADVAVARGQPVKWINRDPFPHTVTAAGVFDSGNIPAGAAFTFTPRVAGTFEYICTLHPNMRGRVVVR
jgi:plastocyanin